MPGVFSIIGDIKPGFSRLLLVIFSLLLRNLRADLLAGQKITVLLEFERAGLLEVPVKLPAP